VARRKILKKLPRRPANRQNKSVDPIRSLVRDQRFYFSCPKIQDPRAPTLPGSRGLANISCTRDVCRFFYSDDALRGAVLSPVSTRNSSELKFLFCSSSSTRNEPEVPLGFCLVAFPPPPVTLSGKRGSQLQIPRDPSRERRVVHSLQADHFLYGVASFYPCDLRSKICEQTLDRDPIKDLRHKPFGFGSGRPERWLPLLPFFEEKRHRNPSTSRCRSKCP